MPDEKKSLHPETNFLPPLNMNLPVSKKKKQKNDVNKRPAEEQKEAEEKAVEKLIEKLHEKDT